MSTSICLAANTLYYPQGGGHLWVHLNWALGFKSIGCKVYWLEKVEISDEASIEKTRTCVKVLKEHLSQFNLQNNIVLFNTANCKLPEDITQGTIALDDALQADMLFNLRYDLPATFVKQFRRSAFLDLDPGLLQIFLTNDVMQITPHDIYFSIGETVGQPSARFQTGGVKWNYTAPCIALDYWMPKATDGYAPYTTISHWNTDEWLIGDDGEYYNNGKRNGFLPFLDLPKFTDQKLELALCLNGDIEEKKFLTEKGWSIRESWEVSDTPTTYKNYIQNSKGEFSCAKPHYVKLQTAWISDRTLCYLASGKPAIVQHTGQSSFLPDNAGLFRFQNLNDTIHFFEQVATDYKKHCALARSLAEEYFDAKKITANVLQKVLL